MSKSYLPSFKGVATAAGYAVGAASGACTVFALGLATALNLDKGTQGLDNAVVNVKKDFSRVWEALSPVDKILIPTAAVAVSFFTGIESGVVTAAGLALFKAHIIN